MNGVPVPAPDDVRTVLARHIPLYRWHRPRYQSVMLEGLAALWEPGHRKVLDVGGGTGIIAEAISELFPVTEVVSIDIADRFLPALSITTKTYDGGALPFAAAAFDCVVLNNMLHHVPPAARSSLLRECRRVAGAGAIYIKDHVARTRLDHLRLGALDFIGNTPFKGMVEAQYLSDEDWSSLRRETGYTETARHSGAYRTGLFAALCPNRLEAVMKWMPNN